MYKILCCICFAISVYSPLLAQKNTIQIRNNQTSHLVFYSDIIYADIGDDENNIISYTNNILRIKGIKTVNPTNLTVLTKDQYYYSFFVSYNEKPQLNYFIKPSMAIQKFNSDDNSEGSSDKKKDYFSLPINSSPKNYSKSPKKNWISKKKKAPVNKEKDRLYDKAATLLDKPHMYDYIGSKHGDIQLKVTSIYHSLENCFIVYEIRNSGAIPYDISYIEFGIKERRRPKKTALHEKKLTPNFIVRQEFTRVFPEQVNEYVAVFGKLAVPSDRLLYMEIVEDGRNIHLDILYHKLRIKRFY